MGRTLIETVCLVILSIGIVSCKATPAPPAGFLEDTSFMQHDPRMPFDEVWFAVGVNLPHYRKVLIRPVDTSHLLEMSWWNRAEPSQLFESLNSKAAAADLADYMEKQLKKVFLADKAHGYQIVDEPDEHTLIIELAIVEVIPTKVWLNAISYIFIGALDTGSAAIEGRFRDGGTNEEIVRLKDREHGQYSLVSIADLQWYAHAKHIIDHWAEQINQVCDLPPGTPISSPWLFTLRPW
jgi:hypothetical protein